VPSGSLSHHLSADSPNASGSHPDVVVGAQFLQLAAYLLPANRTPCRTLDLYEPQFAANASANTVLVENFFEVLLNRLTDSGSASFVNELDGGVAASTVVLQIEGSGEYLGNQVQALFQRYLHRQTDAPSLQAFTNQLMHGATLEQVAAVIVGSPEYFQLHGGSNVAILNALYLDVLGRKPEKVIGN
jgi:hypothetical protein